LADAALAELSPLFDQVYAADGQGRLSIPPERLLKASLLISPYSVRSERAFCEELTYHLLLRWFLDMDLVEPEHVAKNRQAELCGGKTSAALMQRVRRCGEARSTSEAIGRCRWSDVPSAEWFAV
jgi:transposase